jgi:hypothetical protein
MDATGDGSYSRKKVVAAAAVEEAGFHAALLESAGRSRTGTSRSAPAFQLGIYHRGLSGDPS